jgi:hypothetical protein
LDEKAGAQARFSFFEERIEMLSRKRRLAINPAAKVHSAKRRHLTEQKWRLFMAETRVFQGEAQEDRFTAAIEKRTAKIPSSLYLGCALASMAVSLAFKIAGKDDTALFVGQWAAPFLILGEYNKLVKQRGSGATSESRFAA